MESENGFAWREGVLLPVADTSDAFKNCILAPLQSAYLYEESRQSFKYTSAALFNNPALKEKYDAFRANRKEAGYSEEELKEIYGFLLFDDVSKAYALGETGVLSGLDACTTLGDPSKGVYISMYSDCLDLNRWYHGKSGYIVLIRLTKGRVKKVSENYTQNFTAPTPGFDCHVSEQFPLVSAKTSSFLAFERTQYYMYELLDNGSSDKALLPSAACPFAIVSFSYTDTKAILAIPQERSEDKKTLFHYLPWRGQLQIGSQLYNVGLRSTATTLVTGKLPPVVKVDRAISMLDLRQLLPQAVFETCFSSEVFLDGLYCSVCELVPSETEESTSLSLLLHEIKDKDLALPVLLNDGGFLILLHSSYFLTYDDATEVLQGLFVFPQSQLVQKETKLGGTKAAISPEILKALPVLTYAEAEVEKTTIDSSEELCDVLVKHMHSYAALLNPGLPPSPSRDVSIFPDQYDVPDAHKHLYSSPEWTPRAWQTFNSYLSKPFSFQLPVSKVSEILAVGQEGQREDFDDDVYICLSSPEEVPPKSVGSEDESMVHNSVNVETVVDSAGAQDELTTVPPNVSHDWLAECVRKDNEISDLTALIKKDMAGNKLLNLPMADDIPAELIVSITSAKRTVTDESLVGISAATKHNDFDFSAGVNSLNEEALGIVKRDPTEVSKLRKTKRRKRSRFRSCRQKKASKPLTPTAVTETPSLLTVQIPVENDISISHKDDVVKQSSVPSQLSNPSNIPWRKLRRRKRIFCKLSAKNKKLRSAAVSAVSVPGPQGLESLNSSLELQVFPLRKKTERWDLQPVVSECGRILVPHGSSDFADHVKLLKHKLSKESTKDEQCPEKQVFDASVNTVDTSVESQETAEVEQESSASPSPAVEKTESTILRDVVNHYQDVVNSPERCFLRQSDNNKSLLPLNAESSQDLSENDGTDIGSLVAPNENRADTLSPGRCASKGEFLLSKLKSVLLRGKRRNVQSEGVCVNTIKETEPRVKKAKGHSELLENNIAVTSVQDANKAVKEVSEMLSLDPIFARALGLIPKVKPDKIQKTEDPEALLKADSSETQEHTTLKKQTQIGEITPPLSFARRKRIKTLKKRQGIPTEHVKKKCTPFQVSPLSGSNRLLHHHQQLYGNRIQTLHPSPCHEDRSENSRTPEYPIKHVGHRQMFRQSRTFVIKDDCVQVTRQWKDNYDFNLDSKYTSDPKDRTIVRALHGPWDSSIQYSSDELQLIIHIWIGLFYSRSTARFFQIDSNFAYPCSEVSDSLNAFTGMPSTAAESELRPKSSASSLVVTHTSDSFSITKALDLSNKDNYVLDQGAVDLSLRNSNGEIHSSAPQVSTIKCYNKMVELPESVHKDDGMYAPLRRAGCLEYTDAPSLFPHQEKNESVPIGPGVLVTASGNDRLLCGSNKEETGPKDATGNSEGTEISFTQKHATDSSKSVTDDEMESISDLDEVSHTTEHAEIKSKDMANSEMKNHPYKENITEPPKVINLCDDSSKEKINVVCNGCLENGDQLSGENPEVVSPAQTDNVDVDCLTAVKHTKISDEDQLGKKDRRDEKDLMSISSVEAVTNISDETLLVTCDRPDSLMDCNTDRRHHSPFIDQLPQPDIANDDCCDMELGKLSGNVDGLTDEPSTSEESQPMSQMQPVYSEPLVEENLERDCLADKAALCNESTCSLDELDVKTKESAEPEREHMETADCRFSPSSDQENKSTEGARNEAATIQTESFCHQSQSPQAEIIKNGEMLVKDIKIDKTEEGFEKSPRGIVIPFIGVDISGQDFFQPHVSQPQSKVEELVQGQSKIPFIGATTCPDVCRASQVESKKSELSNVRETNQPVVLGSATDERCPTPTLDEEPYNYRPYFGPTNCKSVTEKCSSRKATIVKDEIPQEQKSDVNKDPGPRWDLHPDLELKTLKVLQRIDKSFPTSTSNNKSNRTDADTKPRLNQTLSPHSTRSPRHLSPSCSPANFKCKNKSKTKSVALASCSQLQTVSSEPFILSPFKRKLEEVLGVRLQLKNPNSSVSQHSFETTETFQQTSAGEGGQSFASVPSEHFHAIKQNVDYDSLKAPQSSLNPEQCSYSQRPVMAVKPSKSDDSQEDCTCKDGQIDGQIECLSTCKESSTPVVTSTTQTSREKTESVKGNSEGLNGDEHKASELSSKSDWLSSASGSKSNWDEIKFACLAPPYHYQQRHNSKFNTCASSSQSMQSVETTHNSHKFVDDGQKTKEKENCSGSLKSFVDYKNFNKMDDSLTLGPDTSLMCTVYNTGQKRKYSLLEHVSKRCIQDDLTQTTLEWEHLVFYDQMKLLLKRSRRSSIRHQDVQDKLTFSCASPITVDFSNLEEQEDLLDHFDGPSLVQQKIKVDLSDRKDQTQTNKREKTLETQGTGIPVEHAGVSGVTEECARLYEAMMKDACAVRKAPSISKFARLERGNQKTAPGNNFDFCDQMKREMDESFYSNLNSLVRKSCKTKYRFYIVVTSDDGFFKETKAQLETQGHIAVQPSEFFRGEETSSLLIILKNEDIAEHICEVPHLLELKKTSGVQFAGIDEPDDVINLTHQELFTRGGFVMFDRPALESLTLSNMKKCLDVLQELCETGKWKWMLHYRDSRRLKEKARLSAEAKEKTHFLNWCQDAGIVEVLPYHECDLMSKDQPDYPVCLVNLQVQNISARYPLFITDTKPDSAFGRSGILTMSVDSYLKMSPGEAFTV